MTTLLLASGCNLGSPTITASVPIPTATANSQTSAAPVISSTPSTSPRVVESPSPSSTVNVADNIETTVVSKVVYYDISGDTVGELRTEMAQKGHEGLPGYLHWFVSWSWDQSGTEPCYVPSASVTVETTTTLPNWTGRGLAERNLRTRWDDFVEALNLHETGHASNAEETGERIEAMLENVSAPTCRGLAQVIDDLAGRELDEARRWDIQYDRRTGHGATQGAEW